MRHLIGLGSIAVVLAQLSACSNLADDYEEWANQQGGGGTGGDGGGGGGTPGECVPSEAAGPIAPTCGLFVSADMGSDEAGDGSQASPYATIGKGLEEAGGGAVYACVADYDEAVTVSDAVDLFGGLSCLDWSYTTELTRLNGPADTIAMVVQNTATGTRVFDFAMMAADAEIAGGSSIAVLVDQAAVEFDRCDMTAGNGADGALGATPDSGGLAGEPGGDGIDGCGDANMHATSAPATKTCPNGGTTRGGRGGFGDVDTAGSGLDGISDPAVSSPAANGGKGQTGAGGPNACADGTVGADGASGEVGSGATGVGLVDGSGYTGVAGGAGVSAGSPAQGGGGGGGTQGQHSCTTLTMAGASGGNGGSGGCGGAAGQGGGAGGSSIALVSVAEATVSLTSCTLTAAAGGLGGQGSGGEEGGNGGGPGDGGGSNDTNNACDGGWGGAGGRGGAAGGGLGGHSVGIAHTGTAPTQDDVTITVGSAGDGGLGGDGGTGNQGDDGDDGEAQEVLSFE